MSLNSKWLEIQNKIELMYVNAILKSFDEPVDNLTALKSRPTIRIKSDYRDLDMSLNDVLTQCRFNQLVNLPPPAGGATEATLLTRATEATLALLKNRADLLATEATLATKASEATLATMLTLAGFQARINTLGQKTMAASTPIVIASDQPAIQVTDNKVILSVSVTAAVNVALTATLPAAGAGLFHYIVSIELVKFYSVVGIAGAPVLITTTNFPTTTWTTEQAVKIAGTAEKVVRHEFTTPVKSSAANVATTFVSPAQLQTIWRWNIKYYTGV